MKNRNTGKIEQDKRISKSNFGSRPKYSIETVILQKRIIYNNSKLTNKLTICNMTDLEACYDRQLTNIGSILKELI